MQANAGRVSRPRDWRRLRGVAAEQIAADYLIARGLEVLERNLRCRLGELDLVCIDRGVLAIVEVRQRSSTSFGGAAASVTSRKQRKIIAAARYFMSRRCGWAALHARFDVIALQGSPQGPHSVDWIKDAFRSA